VSSTPLTRHWASVSVVSGVTASGGPVTRVSRVPLNRGSRYYTRWLGQISNYLTAEPQRGNGARP
jgi:hypothetical protein